jgi:pimeloyl-ACP methyl ester carboxylesterase|tara:strand:+ start:43 stop:1125 length:1083 start_codon:yes stop_codon:yes gene_type:complete
MTMKLALSKFRPLSLILLIGVLNSQLFAQSANDQSPIDGVSFRFIESNGITLRIAEMGESGPLLLLAHGWPESWYSWRHQIVSLANAGYRVVASDMRGFGESEAPPNVDDYDVMHTSADLVGILDALEEETAVLVGHDWGAIVAWQTVLMHPTRFTALINMSVPYRGRPAQSPMERMRQAAGDNFHYIVYHNEPGGVAEAEYDANPRGLISHVYLGIAANSETLPPKVTDPLRSAGGWIDRLGAPIRLPEWLTENDLNYIVSQFEKAGFRGGVNYYRNFHRNWEITEHLADEKITIPTLFIAGEEDFVIGGATKEQLTASMSGVVEGLRDVVLIPNTGHWVQQEAPQATTAAMLEFLNSL